MSDSEMHRPDEGAFRSAHAPYELEFEGELSGAAYHAWNRANLESMVTARHLPQDVIERARQKLRELYGEVPTPPPSDPPQLPPITIYSMLDVYT
jgi:hypothetical protein